jgi:plastocyanin
MKTFLLLALALSLAACGSENTSGQDGSGGSSLDVSETEFALDPSNPTVDEAGDVTIRVVNDGEFEHALELEGNGVEEETETIAAGKSAELTVELPAGTYEIYCPIGNHREQGMEGTLVVGGGAGGTGTGGAGSGGTTTGESDDGYGYG